MSYSEWSEQFFQYKTNDPNECIHLGVLSKLNDLPNPSSETILETTEQAKALLQNAQKLDQSDWSFDEKLDVELAKLSLEYDILTSTLTFNHKTSWQQFPEAAEMISSGLFMLFINDPREPEQRLKNIHKRLEKVGWFCERMLARLERPILRWVKMDLESMLELPDFFDTLVNWAKKEQYSQIESLEQAAETAKKHCLKYCDDLSRMPTTEQFSLGPELAQEIIRTRGIDLTLNELHQLASDFLNENSAHMERLRTRLVEKYELDQKMDAASLHAHLNKKFSINVGSPVDLTKVLKRYEEEKSRIDQFIDKDKLFPIIPEQAIQILQTPKFMEPTIPAGAMMPPQPFREGTKTSLVYLTLSEELLDEHTQLGIPTMMIHEGIPGHHLQLAWGASHPSVIRKLIHANDQAEGWTTMLEDYMLDMNYMGELTDECRFLAKRELARMGARVAIDLYFMSGEEKYLQLGPISCDLDLTSSDPFINAAKLLKKVSGFTDGRIQAELNWYSTERGYPLSYLTGNSLVWQLKKDFEMNQQNKSSLDRDRLFHQTFLEAGNMPVRFLREVFKEKQLI